MTASTADLLELEGGAFLMGSQDPGGFPEDGEGPVREVVVEPFRIAAHAVTNEAFASFVAATSHRTTAERLGTSFVFAGLLPDDFPPTRAVAQAPWWRQVEGADWRRPEGPGSSIEGRADHPVVHVSWTDARAHSRWAGLRLPDVPGGGHRCNIWQGSFPDHNTCEDGHYGTAPVDVFEPNGFGLRNTSGNAWEWCADWFDAAGGPGPGRGKVIRGGSYLCHESYCNRYRVAARSRNTPESTTGHMGFRVAADLRH
jgi:formylglycine-generating enzyme